MELFHLRQTSEMYGYSIEWNSKESSVTLVYMGKMDGNMMKDDMMMKDDEMMEDNMMESGMKPAGETIKLWIGSKKIMVNGKQVNLNIAPIIDDGSTYVVETLITQYMKPAWAMK
ncbi:Copper amine oxidase N-terminal domain-containing protein [Paenibacillus sp. 1_12]|nr:Copper amine oxidase N-terminal domain-containing protein [Paenibacillus sp. 1_12]